MENTPISGGINQVQLWLLICIGYVFLAVLIYAFILCQIQHKSCSINAKFLDKIGIVFMPFSFGIFAASYFLSATYKDK